MATQKDIEIVTMATKNGDGIELIKYQNDIVLPKMFMQDEPDMKMEAILDTEYRDGDVILCTFAKCGTHWVGHMIYKLTHDDDTKPTRRMLEIRSPEDIASQESPRIITSHLWPARLPTQHVQHGGKTVLVLRNPKDVAVSLYYHLRNATLFSNAQTWEEYVKSFLEGYIPCGSYFDYLDNWSIKLNENERGLDIEVFFYEDFITDCFQQLKRLSKFLGTNKSDNELTRIVEDCSLKNLKDTSKTVELHGSVADKDGQSVIYRRGGTGDWKNHFTMAQNEQFDALLRDRQTAFKFNYGA